MRKRYTFLTILAAGILFTACTKKNSETGWRSISQEEAHRILEEESGYILLDVRTKEEYDEKHIPKAVNVPNETIRNTRPEELPDLNQKILVYCRSGSRSKDASQKLADLGYTNVLEIGGIKTWAYDTISSLEEEAVSNEPILMLDKAETAEVNGVKMTVTGYADGQLQARIQNSGTEVFTYGEPFAVKQKMADGTVRELAWEEERMWIMIAYELPPSGTADITCSLAGLEKLDAGEYFLVKNGIEAPFELVYSE
ncbi:MAG: rhodanese-like domain-containing protein [Solobacterium sp.]|nr:rhodanese-like domain-containing protein [Solobacterium sp.]